MVRDTMAAAAMTAALPTVTRWRMFVMGCLSICPHGCGGAVLPARGVAPVLADGARVLRVKGPAVVDHRLTLASGLGLTSVVLGSHLGEGPLAVDVHGQILCGD